MNAMGVQSAAHDATGHAGLDARESTSAPVSIAATLIKDQHSSSFNAKKRPATHIPVV